MYAKKIDRNRMIKLVDSGALLIDMRTPVEYRNGSVDGAVNLPLRNLLNKISPMNRDTKLILFSNIESDVDVAVKYALELGFHNLFVSDYLTLRD